MNVSTIFSYLQEMNEKGATDLYLTVGSSPKLRIEDEFVDVSINKLTVDDVNDVLGAILTSRQRREYETTNELNNALDMGEHGRYRVNVFRQRQMPALVIRRIISKIPSVAELNLPASIEEFAMSKRGLVLITGMTGSGKSTTLAAMIDKRNSTTEGHIVTIEDPIEYFHLHKKSVVNQREVGVDTESYAVAMKNSLRQRPDVILVGEIRDREVMEQALVTAETGHLCLSTIHTNNSYQAIERIVNMFPEDAQSQIRLNLAMNLRGIVSQRLVPSVDGKVIPAVEIMINEGLVKELILKGDVAKIKDVMEKNNNQGMCSFDQSLLVLLAQGRITEDTAIANSDMPSDMRLKIKDLNIGKGDEGINSGLHGLDTSVISLKE